MERQEPLSLNHGSRYKTLIFDFDGTIHDTIHVYFPAFLKGYQYLVDHDMAEPRTFTPKEVSIWLGYNSDDMWKTFMPNCPEVFQNKAKSIIGDEMRLQLESGNGVLYSDAHDVLTKLVERGYKLVFLSNCSEVYMNTAIKVFGLDRYFHQFVCSGQYEQLPKPEILSAIKHTLDPEMAIIGDRFHDMEAGIQNGITTIGCAYGYGESEELRQADKVISSLGKLLTLF
jgi:phosphoglycolate phosphatase